MAKIKYPEGRSARDHLRDALKRRGRDGIDDIAQGIREHWGYGHLRSYRLALELGQPQVCDRVNTIQGTHVGDAGHFGHQTLSKLERWPTYPRRPTVGQLAALAQVFDTTPRKLIADIDWDKFPPADRVALQALDAAAPNGTTEVATPAGMMETTRPHAAPDPRPHIPWAPAGMVRSGNPIERITTMTGDETAQYGDRASVVGETVLEQLRADLTEQSQRFPTAPRFELFANLRLLRDRLFHYLDLPGRTGVSQTRDLHFLAGVACGLLATVTDDLGNPSAAMSHIRTAHMFAKEAGEPALTAWLHAQQAVVCYWSGQHAKARDHARRGQDLNPAGTVAVFLPAVEARASGELRDAPASRAAIHKVIDFREHVRFGNLDAFGGFMSFNQAKQHFYVADSYLGIHDHADAIIEATASIEAYENGPAEEQAYDNIAIARFHTAVAYVWAGDLDAAQHAAQAALHTAPEHRHAQVVKSAQRLHRQLCASAIRSAPPAVDTRDQIEDFLSVTPARLEFS